MSDEKIIDTQANIDFVHGMDRICLTKCVTKTATIFHTRSHHQTYHTQPFNSTQRHFSLDFSCGCDIVLRLLGPLSHPAGGVRLFPRQPLLQGNQRVPILHLSNQVID